MGARDHYEFDVLENGKDHFQRPKKKKKRKKKERWRVGYVKEEKINHRNGEIINGEEEEDGQFKNCRV